jgi:apolipoprotein N-acyltransferase
MKHGSGWIRIAAAVATGLMVAGLFPPFHFSVFAWVAMMPLLAALGSVKGRGAGWKGFGIGYLAGIVTSLVQLRWLAVVSPLGVVILPLYLACFWGLFGAFAATFASPSRKFQSSRGAAMASLRVAFCQGAVWAGLEWLRGWLFTGFGWNGLGVAFHDVRVMAQAADLLGVAGLSLALVFFQAVLVQAGWQMILRRRPAGRWDVAVAVSLMIFIYGYGKARIASEGRAESLRLKTLLVQINIPQDAARVLWTDLQVHQAYEDETLKALDAMKSPVGEISPQWPDWVMWPESALTGRILRGNDGSWGTWQINLDTLEQVRKPGPFSLIYGVTELEAEKSEDGLVQKPEGSVYNSIAVMSPEERLQTYRKRHLVIFGETIPWVDSFPLLKKIYEQQAGVEFGGSFTPGDSVEPLPIVVHGTTIGAIPTVCFEDTVGRLVRKFIRPGPQVIINVTNDGWFKDSPAAAQHFANARFRAIELRRPMLRCANSGVSAALDSTGSTAHPDSGAPQVLVDGRGSHFTRGSLLTELAVPLRPGFSLFAVIGDWGILGLAALGLILAVFPGKSAKITEPNI